MTALTALPAWQQAQLICDKQVSSRELVQAHLEQIARVQPQINAVTQLLADEALQQAEAADQQLAHGEETGPLHGVPFSVKDSFHLEGARCTGGTLGRQQCAVSNRDATLVARLKQAGAIPIAKTNLPDLLFAFESDNLIYGRTSNPYDLTRSSGGSSGGEAALIAACGSPLGLGSDAAGSIRLPAHACGIAGLKPTSGRFPRTGHYPPASGWIESLWQIGPMARSVADLALVLPLFTPPDGRDHTHVPMPVQESPPPSELRVAFYLDNGFATPLPEVRQTVRRAVQTLCWRGVKVEEKRPPGIDQTYDLEMALLGVDGGAGLRAYLHSVGSERTHPLLEAWLSKLIPYATDLTGFAALWARWDVYRERLHRFLDQYDAIVCPVHTHPAFPHGTSVDDEHFHGFSYTMAYNVAGLPGAVVRCGTSPEGLPIGVQVVTRAWREDVALAVAARLEQDCGGWQMPKWSADH